MSTHASSICCTAGFGEFGEFSEKPCSLSVVYAVLCHLAFAHCIWHFDWHKRIVRHDRTNKTDATVHRQYKTEFYGY